MVKKRRGKEETEKKQNLYAASLAVFRCANIQVTVHKIIWMETLEEHHRSAGSEPLIL